MPDIFGLASITVKFVLYTSVLTSVGTLISMCVFRSSLINVQTVLRRIAISLGVVALLATILSFSLRGSSLTGDVSGMVDQEMLGILWQTSVGDVLIYRLVGLTVLILGLLISGVLRWLSLLGGLLSLWSFAQIGHVASEELFWVDILLFIHLTAASFWIGILMPLSKLAKSDQNTKQAADLGHQFGQVATIIVPLLILAGLILTWNLVGSLDNLFGTGYGISLLIKTAIVGSLLFLATLNKLRFIPAMQSGDKLAAQHLVKSIRFEWIAFFGILLATATFTSVLTLPT